MDNSLTFLYSLQKLGMKFGLHNIRSILRSIGNPHKHLRTIHIAGTNGKGSTSSMIAAILTAAGYNVGLYTSPHLVKFNERIRINGKMISDADVARYTAVVAPSVKKYSATFFEATTAIAFKYFYDNKVDAAVIETGLGGRLDSTNVIRPVVSVITSIGKDHTEILGKNVASIAKEKAGIIKYRAPTVIGVIDDVPRKIIVQEARKKKSPLVLAEKLTLPESIKLQLSGKHQKRNAKTALGAITVASKYFLVGDRAIREGLERTAYYSGLRGRFELICGKPDIILDVAHNPDGMKVLVGELKQLPYKNFVVLFGVMKEKNHRLMIQHLAELRPTIIATQPVTERALPAQQIFDECKLKRLQCSIAERVPKAILRGKELCGKEDVLVITGSHYLVGESIPIIEKKP